MQSFGSTLFAAFIYKLFADLFEILMPLLLKLFINFMVNSTAEAKQPHHRPEQWKGILWSFCLFFCGILQTLFSQHYYQVKQTLM